MYGMYLYGKVLEVNYNQCEDNQINKSYRIMNVNDR